MNRILWTLGISVLGLSVILILYLFSNNHTADNSFTRAFPKKEILDSPAAIDLGNNSYYIAGLTDSNIYLGNRAPLQLLSVNYALSDSQTISIKNPESSKITAGRIKIDYPEFALIDFPSNKILTGSLKDLNAEPYAIDSVFLIDAVQLNRHSFVIRTSDNKNNNHILAKESDFYPYLTRSPQLLKKQIDGQFCVDGMLHYSKETHQFVYIYYYRNQFILMDTSLNLIDEGRTIDTISHAKLKIGRIDSDKSITLAAPPLTVNKKSCIFNEYLLINSGILSSAEDERKFKTSSVIDVYSLKDTKYIFSFYIPAHLGLKVKYFEVYKNKLVAIYGNYLVIYPIDTSNFKTAINLAHL